MIKTLGDLFKINLVALRGARNKRTVAHGAGIPYTTYIGFEGDPARVPGDKHMDALSRYFNVPITRFFRDPDYEGPSPQEALQVLSEELNKPLSGPLPRRLAAVVSQIDDPLILRLILRFSETQLENLRSELFSDKTRGE